MKQELLKKLKNKKAYIAVIGLGRVGLPTASIFAEAGFKVIGTDVDEELIKDISFLKVNFKEPGLKELVKKVVKKGNLTVISNVPQAAAQAEIEIICVQTPLAEGNKPDLTFLEEASKAVARGLTKGKLVIIVSTVPPGTTKRIAEILEKRSGLKCGIDFGLAYCPERISPGRILREFKENARLIGGFNRESGIMAAALFKTVTNGEIIVTDYLHAEVAKLAENTFRDVNIAFANELALICEKLGVDVVEILWLANTHPRVNIHRPSCGVGGPCLTKDPFLLLHPAEKKKDAELNIIKDSRKLNDFMASHTVNLITEGLIKVGKKVKHSKIAVFGVAYKGETSDTTNSPAEKIINKLLKLEAQVMVYDPYCEKSFGGIQAANLIDAVKDADCLVIATDHKVFGNLDLQKIRRLMKENPILVDGKRIVNPVKAKKEGFVYYGIGYGSVSLP
jgi:UDP-N-acetyl-D-mannosaminuronic acid dehydrogenase